MLQQCVNQESPDVQSVFQRGGGIRDRHLLDHGKAREFQKNIYFCFFYYAKDLTMWITTNCGKFLKCWEYLRPFKYLRLRPTYLSPAESVYR